MSPRPAPDAGRAADGPAGFEGRPATPIPAATVVLLRPGRHGPEVLLTRRPSTMAFGPDIHVFPGGRIDAADAAPTALAALAAGGLSAAEAAARLGLGLAPADDLSPAAAAAHFVAAVRETEEETGIRIAAADLISLSRWVTPISLARRFDVRFFAAFVAAGTDVGPGSDEVAATVWLEPAEALAAAGRGEIEIWQPTFVTLQQLAGLADADAVRAAFAPGDARGGPRIDRRRDDLTAVEAAWAAGIPGRRARGWLVGRREIVVVDPADPTGVTTDAVRDEVAARGGHLAGVVVRSLAPERHAGVEMFAHGLGLPVAAEPGVVRWAPYPVEEIRPGGPLPFGEREISVEALRALD